MSETTDKQLEEITEIRLSNYFWILFRNKWSVLFIFLFTVFAAFVVTDLTAPVYKSETTLRLLDNQQATSLLSQLPLSGFLGGKSGGVYAALLQSRDTIITPAVQQLRAEGILEPEPIHRGQLLPWLANRLNVKLTDTTEQGELTPQEWEDFFIKTLIDEQLKVEESPDGNVITITLLQRTPERAQQLANRIANVFIDTIETETARNMRWWEKEAPQQMLNETENNLKTAEEKLAQFQKRNPEITINADGSIQAQRILALQLSENELVSQLVGAKLKIDVYKKELENIEENLISETVTKNPSYSKLKDNLNEYEIERKALIGKYGDTAHPEITALDEKIKETRARLDEEEPDLKSTTSAYNPLHQVITEKINEGQAIIIGLEEQKAEVAAQIAANLEKLGSWSATQIELFRLKRDVEIFGTQVVTLKTRMMESEVTAQSLTESVSFLDKARLPEEPVKPQKKLNLLLGAMLGALLGFTYAVAKNYFKDTYLRLEEAVEQLDALPEPPSFLGVIPSMKKRRAYRLPLIVHDAPRSKTAEAFRALQAKLPFLNPSGEVRTILVTSATRGEGKSTISANLAAALAQNGDNVLLIDADMRRPSQHKIFATAQPIQDVPTEDETASEALVVASGAARKPGLSEALIHINTENAEDVLHATVKPTDIPNLQLISGGAVPPNPIQLLNSEMMTQWLELAKSEYDVIVIDSPPVRAVADPMILAPNVDAIVYVFDITKTRRTDVLAGVRHLTQGLPKKGIGVLCNMINPKHAKSYGYYSRHTSYYELAEEDTLG